MSYGEIILNNRGMVRSIEFEFHKISRVLVREATIGMDPCAKGSNTFFSVGECFDHHGANSWHLVLVKGAYWYAKLWQLKIVPTFSLCPRQRVGLWK